MDIVPPGPRKNTRVAPTLQPVSRPEDVTPEPPVAAPVDDVPVKREPPTPTPPMAQHEEPTVVAPSFEPTPEQPAPTDAKKDIGWPDPLDFHDIDKVLADDKDTNPQEASPFLTEAKVEKRPLGAFSSFGGGTPSEPPTPRGDAPDAPKPDDTTQPAPVVDELTPEDDGTFKEPEALEAPAEPTPEPPRQDESEDDPLLKLDDEPKKREILHESTSQKVQNIASMSIPRQYHTEEKPTDTSLRPVFDTKEYHPPLLEATVEDHREGGGWAKLFIALIVLVLLGAGGYLLYLFVVNP
jgi:hypothetical protein